MNNDPYAEFRKLAMDSWQQALWKLVQPPAAASSNPGFGDFFNQFIGDFGGLGSLGATRQQENPYVQFGEFFQRYLEQLNTGSRPLNVNDAITQIFRENVAALENSLSSFSWLKVLNQFDIPGAFHTNETNQVLPGDSQKPAFGPSREWQLELSALASASERHNNAQLAMLRHCTRIFESASRKFWTSLGDDDGELSSLKAVYDHWINCAESIYADVVMTDEYARDFAELINSQSESKRCQSAITNRLLEMLNIPNRREVDGLIAKQRDLQNQLQQRQEQDSTAQRTEQQFAELRGEIKALQKALAKQRKSTTDKMAKNEPAKSNAGSNTKKEKSRKGRSRVKGRKKSSANEFEITEFAIKS